MKVSTFFTCFFIFYFPLCIAFYANPRVPEWIDEAMTLLLFLYTMMRLEKIRKKAVKKEFGIYVLIMLFYVVYSLAMAVNVSASVFLDFQQQVRPYVVFYCTWLLAPQLKKSQQKYILWVMYSTIALYIPTALGRAEDVIIGQLCLNCAMIYYLFHPESKKNTLITLGIASIALVSPKMKFIGEYIFLIGVLYFLRERLKLVSLRFSFFMFLLTLLVLFFTWEKFDPYFVSGIEKAGYERIARTETYKAGIKILVDYIPFGSGLGTFATHAAEVYYSPLYYKYDLNKVWGLAKGARYIADAYYPTLAEYGLVGVFLFGVFWKRRLFKIQNLADLKYYRVGMMAFFALALESIADTSYLSGKGMGYFMLLGLMMNAPDRNAVMVKDEEECVLKDNAITEVVENEYNHHSTIS